jgi:hypothetical protein
MKNGSVAYQRDLLLEIGRRLQAEYDAVKSPLPERIASLVKQLETKSAICPLLTDDR